MAAEENAVFTALGLNEPAVPYLGTLDVNETEDELGRGSFAVVYKTKWCGLKVAAKALHSILIDRRNQGRDVVLHDFGAEIARMARLRHPHLCQIFGVGMVGTTPAIVVEFMSDTLETMSVGARRQDLLQLIRYIEHTAAGLHYLHSIPMVHHDLKPSNVLVDNGVAKITDLGLSTLLPSVADQFREAAQSMTQQPGTQLFMPPEALQETESGRARYDLSLDVFSFGVTAMSVLSGVMPSIELMFAPRSRQAADGSHVAIPELERRHAEFARIPDGHPLKDLVRRCLADPPARRPAAEEIHEFVQGVTQFLSSLPQTAPPLEESMGASAGRITTIVDNMRSLSTVVRDLSTSLFQQGTRLDNLSAQVEVTNNRMTQVQQEISAEARTSYEQVAQLSDTMARGEQDTTAACERIVEMQKQTNTTVRQLQEQSATSTTSIGQLLEQQQDTSDEFSRVSAAIATIQQDQSDMRSDLEGKIGDVQSAVTAVSATMEGPLRKFTTLDGTFIRDIGRYGSGNGEFNTPTDVAVDDVGDLAVVDRNNRRLMILHQDGRYVKTIGNGTLSGSYGVAALSLPQHGICYAVTDINDHSVRVFEKTGRQLNKFGTAGSGPGQFNTPLGIISSNGRLLVVDKDNHRIQVFTTDGNFIAMFGSWGESDGQFKKPRCIAEDNHGHFLVTDADNHRVQVFTSDTFWHVATFGSSTCFNCLFGIAVSPSGTVYVSDWGSHCVTMF
ncbi:probable serine/threonine-protein kinase DDB_G0284251 isoform X2 [Sycon ciliatum]|uniref:probable serine/threonine-protein kinase DDB_G0284251 isoform X2 n=1 Tax=Sycon ciliatum TaxID=27933 RepID=UPI0031F612F1